MISMEGVTVDMTGVSTRRRGTVRGGRLRTVPWSCACSYGGAGGWAYETDCTLYNDDPKGEEKRDWSLR